MLRAKRRQACRLLAGSGLAAAKACSERRNWAWSLRRSRMLAVLAAVSILAAASFSTSWSFLCSFARMKTATVSTQKTSAGNNQRDQRGLDIRVVIRVWLTVAQTGYGSCQYRPKVMPTLSLPLVVAGSTCGCRRHSRLTIGRACRAQ